jgi:hypothetical protein
MTAIERKQKTEKLLKSLNIPFIDHLPMIEEENEARIRSAQDIAKRILILTYLCFVAEDQDAKSDVIDFLKAEKLWDSVSPDEKLLFQKELTEREKINLSWRSEAIWLLLWVINKVSKLELPQNEVNIPDILECLPKPMARTNDFINSATIRTISEILDIADLTYRLHWASRNSESNNSPNTDINSSVIFERHCAINWVTYYADNWDDVTADT